MSELPFGCSEILAAVTGARRVADAGCGSGRLTVALARAGADVTGFDTSASQLDAARERAADAGVELTLLEADFNETLPFPGGAFDAVVSRLAVMASDDPVATLRELRRVLAPGGRLVTVLWASPEENPWFSEPRAAVATTLGPERARFARAFGRLGDPESAAAAHSEAGLVGVQARRIHELRRSPDARTYWQELAAENGHYRRIVASLDDKQREALAAEVERRLAVFDEGGTLALPRTLVVATATR